MTHRDHMKISVCMATYNGGKYLKEQLDSILKQLSSDDELIISDDGSIDNTLKIVSAYNDKRIKIYRPNCKNVIFNFENALKKASGDIIVLSDQDDIWKSNKVEVLIKELKNHTLVFSNALVFECGNLDSGSLLYSGKNNTGFFKNLLKNRYIGATMAFRSELLQIALPFPKQIPMHDMWLGLLAEINGTTGYIREPLIYYRRHAENVSTTGQKSGNSLLKKIEFRLSILFLLCKRTLLSAR